jgi:type IX secretion system PorP/SprF family membrane protein
MIKKHFFLLILLLRVFGAFSQDAYFTNANQSLIYLNPSFAGTNGFIREQSIYRVQDNNQRISFKTFCTSLDAFIKPLNGGMAFSYLNDDQAKGFLKTSAASFAYAQHVYAYNKTVKIIPAIQATYFMKSLDLTDLKFRDTLDYRKNSILETSLPLGQSRAQKNNLDLNASILIQTKNLTFGVGMFHINQPDEGITGAEKLPFRINIHGSYNFVLTPELNVSLFGLFVSQENFKDYDLNCNLSWNKEVFAGVGIRKSNALTANIGFQSNAFRLGLGYDYGLNNINPNIYGKNTFELMLSFNFTNRSSENSPSADWVLW